MMMMSARLHRRGRSAVAVSDSVSGKSSRYRLFRCRVVISSATSSDRAQIWVGSCAPRSTRPSSPRNRRRSPRPVVPAVPPSPCGPLLGPPCRVPCGPWFCPSFCRDSDSRDNDVGRGGLRVHADQCVALRVPPPAAAPTGNECPHFGRPTRQADLSDAGTARGHRAGRVPDRTRDRAADRRGDRCVTQRPDDLRPPGVSAGRSGGHRRGAARQVPGHRHRARPERATHRGPALARAPGQGRLVALVGQPVGGAAEDGRSHRAALRLANGGFDITEAGTKKSVAAAIVADPTAVPGVARLGPDALSLDPDAFVWCSRGKPGGSRT